MSLALFSCSTGGPRLIRRAASLDEAAESLRATVGPLTKRKALFPLPDLGEGWVALFGAGNRVVAARAEAVGRIADSLGRQPPC